MQAMFSDDNIFLGFFYFPNKGFTTTKKIILKSINNKRYSKLKNINEETKRPN